MRYATVKFKRETEKNSQSTRFIELIADDNRYDDIMKCTIESFNNLENKVISYMVEDMNSSQFKDFQEKVLNRDIYDEYVKSCKLIGRSYVQYEDKLKKDIDETNMAMYIYNTKNALRNMLRRLLKNCKITLKEFDEYTNKLFKAYNTDKYDQTWTEVKNEIKNKEGI